MAKPSEWAGKVLALLKAGNTAAAIIVSVQADNDVFAVFYGAAEQFNLIGIDVRRRHFHGGGQIENHLVIRRRLPHIAHGFAYFHCVLHFGTGETFR